MTNKFAPVNLEEELVEYLKKKHLHRKYRLPQIGIYYPTTLVQNCTRSQWNFYMMSIQQRKFPDDFVLKISEGQVWHDMLEGIHIWDSVEGSARMRVRLEGGGYITIRGRYDAVRSDTVYDFKRTERVPWGYKAKFAHLLQLNFYMACLGKPKGVVAYIGYENGVFHIKEYYHVLTDWMTQTLINKALTLHTHLVNNVAPNCTCRTRIHEIEWLNYQRDQARNGNGK